jgi:hypothetical protein
MDRYLGALEKVKQRLLMLDNVVGVGVGYKESGLSRTSQPSMIVFVEKKVPKGELRSGHLVPAKLYDLDTDVIEIGRVRLLNRKEKSRPVYPGMSIGHYKISAGTFGAVVKDRNTGERLILSNNHILANSSDGIDNRASIGDPVLQPGSYDGGTEKDRIATLIRFSPLLRTYQESECPVAVGLARIGSRLLNLFRPNYRMVLVKQNRSDNLIDAALARPDSPDLIEDEILEIGRVEGASNSSVGDKVLKSGRSSGLTSGTVTAIGVTLQVELSGKEKGWFSDQVVTDMVSRPGDSGSLVVNQKKQAVGLLFAGSEKYTVFNRIQNVLDRLNIRL